MHFHPLYAPDGMRMAGFDAPAATGLSTAIVPGATPDAVLAHERDDDGLVHNHNWAVTSGFRVPGAASGQDRSYVSTRRFEVFLEAVLPQDRHDDGLVHNHGWAVTGK